MQLEDRAEEGAQRLGVQPTRAHGARKRQNSNDLVREAVDEFVRASSMTLKNGIPHQRNCHSMPLSVTVSQDAVLGRSMGGHDSDVGDQRVLRPRRTGCHAAKGATRGVAAIQASAAS